jgi:hypothetical protein
MSASEWARITDERDGAVYHLRQLIEAIKNSPSWDVVHVRADEAVKWLAEEICDEDE